MNRVQECTKQLLDALRESSEYQCFEEYRQRLEKDPQLLEKVNDFRKRVYLLQNTDESNDPAQEMEQLFLEREELHRDEVAGGYLSSELRICRMLQQVNMEIMNTIELGLDIKDLEERNYN